MLHLIKSRNYEQLDSLLHKVTLSCDSSHDNFIIQNFKREKKRMGKVENNFREMIKVIDTFSLILCNLQANKEKKFSRDN